MIFSVCTSEIENHPETANPVDQQIGKKMSMWKREQAKKLRNQEKMYVEHKRKRLRGYSHKVVQIKLQHKTITKL